METITIPVLTSAIFESIGPMSNAIQKMWSRIKTESLVISQRFFTIAREISILSKGSL